MSKQAWAKLCFTTTLKVGTYIGSIDQAFGKVPGILSRQGWRGIHSRAVSSFDLSIYTARAGM